MHYVMYRILLFALNSLYAGTVSTKTLSDCIYNLIAFCHSVSQTIFMTGMLFCTYALLAVFLYRVIRYTILPRAPFLAFLSVLSIFVLSVDRDSFLRRPFVQFRISGTCAELPRISTVERILRRFRSSFCAKRVFCA